MPQELPCIYTLSDIERIANTDDFKRQLIHAIAQGFVDFEQGNFYAAPIQTLGPDLPMANDCQQEYAAQTCVKSGYFRNSDYYVIKVASGGHPWPSNSGLMQVYSQHTGKLEALLLDDGILTEWRTAAVGALVVQTLLDKINCVSVLGTGVQARYQLYMLEQVTTCRHVKVWGRTASNADKYKQDMQARGWKVDIVDSPGDLLDASNVIITTTSARQALLPYKECDTTTRLIICIGSDSAGKQEIDPEWLNKADLKIADVVPQSLERGEFQHLQDKECGDNNGIKSLGFVLSNIDEYKSTIRKSPKTIVFDSSGTAVQDCVVAEMVYKCLQAKRSDER